MMSGAYLLINGRIARWLPPNSCPKSWDGVGVRLFYGCSYKFHLSGDDSRDRYIKGSGSVRGHGAKQQNSVITKLTQPG